MLDNAHVPILGFAAYSGTGKTTLLLKVLPLLKAKGLRVGMIKHAHHSFEVDYPGKDSFELRKAGADQMLVVSRQRWALMVEAPRPDDARLDEVLLDVDQGKLDLILVEGFKRERFRKIELHRPAVGKPLLYPQDDQIIAIASDGPLPDDCRLPRLDLNDAAAIANFVVGYVGIGLEAPATASAGT